MSNIEAEAMQGGVEVSWRKAVRALLRQIRSHPRLQAGTAKALQHNLDHLALLYATDKSSRVHGYTSKYERHLPKRRQVGSLLEIGIGGVTSISGYETREGGQSLMMWQSFFPRAQIVGIDIYPKSVTGPRIHVEQGDQNNASFLEKVASRYGPFDVIIDDGSHVGEHVATAFATLFPHVREGGVYVIEDLGCAYHPAYGGGPPGTCETQVDLVRNLIHDVQRRHWPSGDSAYPVQALHVYEEIAFVVAAGAARTV